jgi:hypothetical protein
MKLERWELRCAIAAGDVATILKIFARYLPEVSDYMDAEWGLIRDVHSNTGSATLLFGSTYATLGDNGFYTSKWEGNWPPRVYLPTG